MSISLTYTTKDGKSAKAKFTNDVTEIKIDFEDIVDIDLTPLSNCHDLQKLSFSQTSLRILDLSSLSSCTNLQTLYLHDNDLQTIDLAPLAYCNKLERLGISKNPLRSIVLSPLSSCSRLKELQLIENQLESIDLQPLEVCKNLRFINLIMNELKEIDLSPLVYCPHISRLAVGGNPLRQIDLTPLSSAQKLQELRLYESQLKSIDLTPLSSCIDLKELALFNNELKYIDLSPLSSCKSLQILSLFGNPIQDIDLTPLIDCRSLDERRLTLINSAKPSSWLRLLKSWGTVEQIKYMRPSSIYPWSFLHWVVEHYGTDYRVQQDILVAMGLGEYGFIDMDLRDFLLSIPSEKDLESACTLVIPLLVERIIDAAHNDGGSINLAIEKVSKRHPEIAVVAPKIVELRKQELEHLIIEYSNDDMLMNMSELWLTAYGFEVLHSIKEEVFEGMSSYFATVSQQFVPVKQAFAEMGIKLKLSNTSVSGNTISEPLKKAIWWIIENEHKLWNEIILTDSQLLNVSNLHGNN